MSEAGLFHIGILLPTLTTLADLLVHLSDFEVPVNGGQQSVATCLFIEDPEGNAIKFYVDRETESWIDEKEGRIRMDIAPLMYLDYCKTSLILNGRAYQMKLN